MKLHANAVTTPRSRKLLIDRIESGDWGVEEAAEAAGVCRATAYKWLSRYRAEGLAGLEDRSSAPRRVWNRTAQRLVRRIQQLRKKRLPGWRIAEALQLALSTVSGILRRLGLGRLPPLVPKEPVVRYERKRAGELLHLDVKKLGRFRRPGKRVRRDGIRRNRGAGWEFVHVCVDDASRMAYVEILPNERKESCAGFLERACQWLAKHGVCVERVMTDNAKAYGSHAFQGVLEALGARHVRTRAYRPETNGKAERFIQTLLREWAYVKPYRSGRARAKALGPWLEHYNHRRPHWSLGKRPPYERLKETV